MVRFRDFAVAAAVFTLPAGAATHDWSGFYAGLSASQMRHDTQFDWVGGPAFSEPTSLFQFRRQLAAATLRNEGAGLGIQLGYNLQSGPWVFGVEADYSFFDLSADRTANTNTLGNGLQGLVIETADISGFATLRGRAGWSSGPLLVYATAGLAAAQIEVSDESTYVGFASNFASFSGWRTGWVIGGGVEWAMSDRWRLKAEYLHADLGSLTYTSETPAFPAQDTLIYHHHDFTSDTVRIGFNYAFGH